MDTVTTSLAASAGLPNLLPETVEAVQVIEFKGSGNDLQKLPDTLSKGKKS
jgi:hypothetical protein